MSSPFGVYQNFAWAKGTTPQARGDFTRNVKYSQLTIPPISPYTPSLKGRWSAGNAYSIGTRN
jgi:hypothetical protein